MRLKFVYVNGEITRGNKQQKNLFLSFVLSLNQNGYQFSENRFNNRITSNRDKYINEIFRRHGKK